MDEYDQVDLLQKIRFIAHRSKLLNDALDTYIAFPNPKTLAALKKASETARQEQPIGFKQRRILAHAFSDLSRQVLESLPAAERTLMEVRLHEAADKEREEEDRFARRLHRSVLPLFTKEKRTVPRRTGSCILVKLGAHHFGFTAGHVLRPEDSSPLLVGTPSGLAPWPFCEARVSSSRSQLDIGVMPISSPHVSAFAECLFLEEQEVDTLDHADDTSTAASYLVLGYPASKAKLVEEEEQSGRRFIHQLSFRFTTHPLSKLEYESLGIAREDYVALEYDHEDIGPGRVNPPSLLGVSGGGIFHISKRTKRVQLAGIFTDWRRKDRILIGTRIKHFISTAREMVEMAF